MLRSLALPYLDRFGYRYSGATALVQWQPWDFPPEWVNPGAASCAWRARPDRLLRDAPPWDRSRQLREAGTRPNRRLAFSRRCSGGDLKNATQSAAPLA